MASEGKTRPDLIGQTGSITTTFKIIDAKEYPTGVSIRVQDSKGDEYWTDIEDVDIDK